MQSFGHPLRTLINHPLGARHLTVQDKECREVQSFGGELRQPHKSFRDKTGVCSKRGTAASYQSSGETDSFQLQRQNARNPEVLGKH